MRIARNLLLILCFWSGMVATAAAHASLTSAQPSDGAVVQTAPVRFSLTFSEPVSPLAMALIRPDGTTIALAHSGPRGDTLHMEAPADLSDGTHVLTWRVVSLDGHHRRAERCAAGSLRGL